VPATIRDFAVPLRASPGRLRLPGPAAILDATFDPVARPIEELYHAE